MEPFSLTCRSCAVKLKVANPQLIGQTLACPKCGTMIRVEHPSGWKPPVSDSVQSHPSLSSVAGGAAGSNFEDIDELLTSPSRVQANASGQTQKKTRPRLKTKSPGKKPAQDKANARGAKRPQGKTRPPEKNKPQAKVRGSDAANDPASQATPRRFQQAVEAGESGQHETAGDINVVVESPILPSNEWASKSARERKKLFLMIGSAAATVLAVAMIIFSIVKLNGASDEQVANGNREIVDPESQLNDAAEAEGLKDEPAESDDLDPEKPSTNKAENNAEDDGFLDDTPTGRPATAISQAGALSDPLVMSDSQESGGFAAPSMGDAPKLEVEPDTTDTAVVPAEATAPKLNQAIVAAPNDSFQKMEQKMGALSGLLADSGSSMRDLQDVSALLSRRESMGPPKYSMEKPKPAKVNFERLLKLPIVGLQANKPVSLAKATRLLTALSGAPISIDARQISMMGLAVNPSLELEIKDKTTLSAAQMLAEQAGLECLVGESALGFSLPAGLENSQAEFRFPQVGELSGEEKQRFVDSIKQLIATEIWVRGESPASASVEGDTIVLNCPEGVQRHVQMMIDRINAAAVLLQEPDDGPSRKIIAARWTASESLRQQKSDWKIGGGRSLGGYLGRIERLHGLTVLIDWQAAMAAGWAPESLVPGELVEPTVGDSLQELAKSMGLSLIGIDQTTVQLTSREAAATALDLEVYPCSSAWSDGVPSQEVEQLIFRALGGNVESNFVRVIFEPRCRCVIVVAPQPLQRQVEGLVKRLNQTAGG